MAEFDADLTRWLADLEARHLANLTFPEVSRALRALSSTYVERRRRIAQGAVFGGAGKRAAFALFYGPLHYLLVRHIASTLPTGRDGRAPLVDLGCGTGAAGAAWGRVRGASRITGIDRHPWALKEAGLTYRAFGLRGTTEKLDIARFVLPPQRADFLAAFALNELTDPDRDRLMTGLVDRAGRGDRILIVEPLARAIAPWWPRWQSAFVTGGGRADEWRVQIDLPPIVAKLDRAAGLDHRELTGRSLWLSL